MYCILNSMVALRSWKLVPYAYYIKNERNAHGLEEEEFRLLSLCDGEHDIEDSITLRRLLASHFAEKCEKGEKKLTDWQLMKCDNRYFPAMNWMITGKCNYNCLHCFNAADNAPLMSEFTLPEAEKLLDEAKLCGINAFTVTGGEPMLHKNFFDIIEGIHKRGMYVEELNTNGFFINEKALDRLSEIGCYPLIKISFDGIGHHDWLRNRKGAEEDAIRAIRLCREHGFRVKAQTNVHKKNLESMNETAEFLDKLGVEEMRIIRTTEAPRWIQNGGDSTLTIEEYYDAMLDFAAKYISAPHNMKIDTWQFYTFNPLNKSYKMHGAHYAEGEYRDNIPVCKGNRGMVAVAANGNVYPCHQLSGTYDYHGFYLGNVKKDGLQKLLTDSDYLSEVCTTVKDLADANAKCGSCKYFKYCCGGCRALGLVLTGEKLGCDLTKCVFWEKGYYDKIVSVMDGWENRSKINRENS